VRKTEIPYARIPLFLLRQAVAIIVGVADISFFVTHLLVTVRFPLRSVQKQVIAYSHIVQSPLFFLCVEDKVKFNYFYYHVGHHVDIFGRVNKPNTLSQGKDNTIIDCIDVLLAFNAKVEIWKRKLEMDKPSIFATLNVFPKDIEHVCLDDSIKSQICQ